MKKIEGSPKSLKQLLQNTKYSIHYYQREYMWQRKHIEELIDDLTSEIILLEMAVRLFRIMVRISWVP